MVPGNPNRDSEFPARKLRCISNAQHSRHNRAGSFLTRACFLEHLVRRVFSCPLISAAAHHYATVLTECSRSFERPARSLQSTLQSPELPSGSPATGGFVAWSSSCISAAVSSQSNLLGTAFGVCEFRHSQSQTSKKGGYYAFGDTWSKLPPIWEMF